MGMQTILIGYIAEPSVRWMPDGNTRLMRRWNRQVIRDLPASEPWPPLNRGMFAFSENGGPFNSYRGTIIHFGGRFKSLEQEWDEWLARYETLLARLYFTHSTVFLHTELAGEFRFDWRMPLEAERGFLATPPRFSDAWEFEGPFRSWDELLKREAAGDVPAAAKPVEAFREPEGSNFSLPDDLSGAELCRALCKTAAFLQAIEPHGAALRRYEDWREHDGLHFDRGSLQFSDLFRMVESPRALLHAVPDEEAVSVGIGPGDGRWYLRFRLAWDDEGFHLLGRFDLTLPPELAVLYREELVQTLTFPLIEQDATEYFRLIRV